MSFNSKTDWLIVDSFKNCVHLKFPAICKHPENSTDMVCEQKSCPLNIDNILQKNNL